MGQLFLFTSTFKREERKWVSFFMALINLLIERNKNRSVFLYFFDPSLTKTYFLDQPLIKAERKRVSIF